MLTKEPRKKEIVVLTVTDADSISLGTISAYHVLKYRLSNKIWAFHSRTKCRKYMKKGTKLVFYITGERNLSRSFVAEAVTAEFSSTFPSYDLSRYVNKAEWYSDPPAYKIELKTIRWFKKPVNIYDIKSKMDMFKKKKTNKWGTFFQGGAFRISDKDYNLINKKSK